MSALGTEFKINVHVEPIDDMHMSNYDFECAFYVFTNKKVIINKSDMRMVDKDNYIAIIESMDAMKLGRGRVNLEFTGYIPDSDFPDGLRTEKAIVCTDVVIV
jgi:hypothetical protein